MMAKEFDGLFSDGAYVVGSFSSANYPSAIMGMLFCGNEQNRTYIKKPAHIWKRNGVFYYRTLGSNIDVECNGFAYIRADGKPSPFAHKEKSATAEEEKA